MLSLYQAERTRAEEQLQQKDGVIRQRDAQLQENEAELQQKDDQIQQRNARILQNESHLQQKTTELDSVQQSLQVLTITVSGRSELGTQLHLNL